MGTVFTLEPAFFTVMNTFPGPALKGTIQKDKTVVPIYYNNSPDPMRSPFDFNAQGGVLLLNRALNANYPKPYIIFGWSLGAEVAYKWARESGPDCPIDPEDLSILSIGNPERKYGGTLGMMRAAADGGGMQSPTWPGGVALPPRNAVAQYVKSGQFPGLPKNNRYPVTDLARQYDYYADYPTVLNPNSAAVNNASTAVHMNYFNVTLNDPGIMKYVEGNVTYLLAPTPGGTAEIESAYERPPMALQ